MGRLAVASIQSSCSTALVLVACSSLIATMDTNIITVNE